MAVVVEVTVKGTELSVKAELMELVIAELSCKEETTAEGLTVEVPVVIVMVNVTTNVLVFRRAASENPVIVTVL